MHSLPSPRPENVMIILQREMWQFCHLSGRCRSSVIKSNKIKWKPQCNGSLVTWFAVVCVFVAPFLLLSFGRWHIECELLFSVSVDRVCQHWFSSKRHSISVWAHIIEMIVGWMKTALHMESIQCVLFDTIWRVFAMWTSDIEQRTCGRTANKVRAHTHTHENYVPISIKDTYHIRICLFDEYRMWYRFKRKYTKHCESHEMSNSQSDTNKSNSTNFFWHCDRCAIESNLLSHAHF